MPLPTSHVFIVPSSPTSGHRTLKLVGLIQREHASGVHGTNGIGIHDGVNTFHQLGAFHSVDAPGVTALRPKILLVRAARHLGAHPT
jgi:hypothetical protein